MLVTVRKTKIGKLASHSIVQTIGTLFIVNFVLGFAIAEKS